MQAWRDHSYEHSADNSAIQCTILTKCPETPAGTEQPNFALQKYSKSQYNLHAAHIVPLVPTLQKLWPMGLLRPMGRKGDSGNSPEQAAKAARVAES